MTFYFGYNVEGFLSSSEALEVWCEWRSPKIIKSILK